MEITRIFDLLDHYKDKYSWKTDAIAGKINGQWQTYSIDDYIEKANLISYGLLSKGIVSGDKIAIISSNRPEWNLIDMGILQIGAIPLPIYPTISESDYNYILNHAEVKLVFVEGEELLRKIEHILPEIPSIKEIYTFKDRQRFSHLQQLYDLGNKNQNPQLVNQLKSQIKTNDVATIIYTSGTTGNPKGVMLSHYNIISNFKAFSHIPPIGSEGRALSYLPLCHVYERILNYMYQYLGISIYYAENLGTISDNIKELKPNILGTVPRLLEKVYDKIINTGRKQKWLKRQVFFWAVSVGLKYELGNKNSFFYNFKLSIANKLVFVKWREALGGNFKVIVSGGAALQPRLARIFTAAGIPVLEGYGLTETSPVIAVNTFDKNGRKFGTVGPVLTGTKVKIAEDGEVLCKGPGVMVGYYKEPELTKEAIDEDGWFHTGDTGILEPEGQLRLNGRKKSIFKTSGGKYVNPELIETKFKESPFIDNIVVLGENQKFAAAIIVPDFAYLKAWCDVKNHPYTTNEEMVLNSEIRKRFLKEMNKYNRFFGDTEQLKKFDLIDFEWTVQTGELTPTLKLKRNVINQKYKDRIEELFN
jgi:long-chain acyl-CoA synthetase